MNDAIPLSEELLGTMRSAAKKSIELHEPFITMRAILLALLDDPAAHAALANCVDEAKLRASPAPLDFGVARTDGMPESGEMDVLATYDTLAFKTPEGRTSVWLARDAYDAFMAGAEKARERYARRHLVFGMAACAARSPERFIALGIAPGAFAQAAYEL